MVWILSIFEVSFFSSVLLNGSKLVNGPHFWHKLQQGEVLMAIVPEELGVWLLAVVGIDSL